jgi:hypothetical protein
MKAKKIRRGIKFPFRHSDFGFDSSFWFLVSDFSPAPAADRAMTIQ